MFIVEVAPIRRGFGKEFLSYFSSVKIKEGTLIKVPIRGKTSWGIAVGSSQASMQKAELRSSSFAMRKIVGTESSLFFEEWWIEAVKKTARYFGTSMGAVMAAFTPVFILENIQKLAKLLPNDKKQKKSGKNDNIKSEILCIQTEDEERWGYYKSAIREEFAKKHSVFLCLSTHEEIRMAVTQFEKGIERYTFVFHSELTPKELLLKWTAVLEETHPVLIIATPQWLNIPRFDVSTIILDREGSPLWKTFSRPYIDFRKAVEFFAKEKKIRLILGDSVLRIETMWSYKNDEILPFEPVKFRISSQAESILVPMKGGNFPEVKGFQILSPELSSLIIKSQKEHKNIFIYATRKGLSSVTVCNDCGEEVLCHNCGLPVVLYKSEKGNVFRCHQCGSIRSAKELCKKCLSWRLLPLGVGIERVVEEVENLLKKNAFRISGDTVTPKKAVQIAEKFYSTPGSVLVGTEMALYYLKQQIDFTAITSIDPLFSIPDFKIREKIFHLILSVKLLARQMSIVQIRNVEKSTIEFALSGNLLDFYKTEIEDRMILQYPPFSVFIKITVRGEKSLVLKESQFVEKFFEKWNPVVFNSISERHGASSATNCVLKITKNSWPDDEILYKILSLPPYFEIKVDPDNLL